MILLCLILVLKEVETKTLIESANKGDAKAHHQLGCMYLQGKGVKQNLAEARK